MNRIVARVAPVTAAAAVVTLTASMAIGGAAPAAVASVAAPSASRPAVPTYYMALPGGDNFANDPGAPTAVVGDTVTGKKLLTVRPFGKDKFVTVAAAADDRTFVLGANPNLAPPEIPTASDWYLVHFTPGTTFRATERKLRIPAPGANDFAAATALSPDGREVAILGQSDPRYPKLPQEWLRVYSVASGALLRSWTGPLNVDWGGYVTLSWESGGHALAIGYTFSVTRSNRIWSYLGVRMLDVRLPGHGLIGNSRLVWSRLTRETSFTTPVPLNCALDIRVIVSANGTVACAASGLLRVYNPNPTGPACPKVPNWASVGFLTYSTGAGKQVHTLFELDTNCILGPVQDVLWISDAGNAVIGYYSLGGFFAKHDVFRFGIFSGGKYTPLPVPPTTAAVPNTIAW